MITGRRYDELGIVKIIAEIAFYRFRIGAVVVKGWFYAMSRPSSY